MNREKRRRKLTQSDLRALGVQPGLLATRYTPDGERATVLELAPESNARRKGELAREFFGLREKGGAAEMGEVAA